jgi:hypothetical protein
MKRLQQRLAQRRVVYRVGSDDEVEWGRESTFIAVPCPLFRRKPVEDLRLERAITGRFPSKDGLVLLDVLSEHAVDDDAQIGGEDVVTLREKREREKTGASAEFDGSLTTSRTAEGVEEVDGEDLRA